MDYEELTATAHRLIKSECRIYALRVVDPAVVSVEDMVRQTRWIEWWAKLKEFPTLNREWLRALLLDVKIDAMQEVSATVGGFDFTVFDQEFSVDRLLPPN